MKFYNSKNQQVLIILDLGVLLPMACYYTLLLCFYLTKHSLKNVYVFMLSSQISYDIVLLSPQLQLLTQHWEANQMFDVLN